MVKNSLNFSTVPFENIDEFARRINDEFESGKVGYFHLPKGSKKLIEKASVIAGEYEYESVVVIGMGGSSLGTKALYTLLKDKAKLKAYFLDNLDIATCKSVLGSINFNKTLFFVVSKSGTTIETITIFKYIIDKFGIKNFKENFIFITDPDSNLEHFAEKHNARIFHIPANVGGRFSVFSAAGIVPLLFLGIDTKEILKGAKACKKSFFDEKDDSILQKAYHFVTHKSAKTNVLFSYGDKFTHFNEWYVQLWAESLGKRCEYKRVGLTPISLIGSRDQHSFLQLIMDGTKDKTVTFIKVLDWADKDSASNLSLEFLDSCDFTNGLNISEVLNLQCDSTMRAVINEGISTDLITLEKIDEWHCGYLIYYYMLLTSAAGIMLNINTYDQPGVEVGKRILKMMLSK
ncbi:glucose-6-phosphate isomerase [Campylobacter corcagiensis]|uniref:Glucose-6-phosphate isomerase n=1 Tax=Campylobacter corcagiensis TaxID=1448857 RepID=A0A7M1LEF0_9BACT|nr:glucose-6-phosphate isomerase [Campylobacter corcagiensis]QKF65146.1 phosphoglucose isomerase [Campylobacter corcagiensis]QOQ86711.1 glucose-6-phosphate isomerase [Campylobacter corcagiensis]